MKIDADTIEKLRALAPREAYESVRRAVLGVPWGASSEDMRDAFEQVVDEGILTWDDVEGFERSGF